MAQPPPVVLTRRPGANDGLARILADAGVPTVAWPGIHLTTVTPVGGADALLSDLRTATVVCVVSPGAAAHALDVIAALPPGPRVVAQGPGTAAELRRRGQRVDAIAAPPDATGLVRAVRDICAPPATVAILRGDRGRPHAVHALRDLGFVVTPLTVYRNEAPSDLAQSPRSVSAVVYASPSAAAHHLDANPWLSDVPTVAIGATTASYLRDRGVDEVVVADAPTETALAHTIQHLLTLERE